MNVKMSKIYIVGDSFFVWELRPWAWQNLLDKTYTVQNYSSPGASNQDIYLQFLEIYKLITPEDAIIIGWSDSNRTYVNPQVKKQSYPLKLYHTTFYNKELTELYSDSIMDKINCLIEDKNLKALFFWSFPSDYNLDNHNPNWVDALLSNLDHSNYLYKKQFKNEVRPALIYFSKKEVEHLKSSDKISKYFSEDRRPNHISAKHIHKELYNIVTEFLENKIGGQIDLLQRLTDGQ
jgi:hypothetical protein